MKPSSSTILSGCRSRQTNSTNLSQAALYRGSDWCQKLSLTLNRSMLVCTAFIFRSPAGRYLLESAFLFLFFCSASSNSISSLYSLGCSLWRWLLTPVVEPPEQDRGTPQRLQTQLFLSFFENHFQTDTVVLSTRGCEEDDADAVDVDGMLLADVFFMM